METKQKRVRNPVRSKQVTAPEPTAQQAPITNGIVAAVEAPVKPTSDTIDAPPKTTPTPNTPPTEALTVPAAQPPKSARTQTNKAIGIHISAARVRRHIDKLNLNAKLDVAIGERRQQLTAYKVAKEHLEKRKIKVMVTKTVGEKEVYVKEEVDITPEAEAEAKATLAKYAPLVVALGEEADAYSHERTRFSNEAAIVLAIVCDELTRQLVEQSMKQALASGKKITQKMHMHKTTRTIEKDGQKVTVPGIETLPLYPLIKGLASFINNIECFAKADRDEEAKKFLKDIMMKAEKDFKKKYEVRVQKRKTAVNGTTTTAATNGATDVTVDAATELIDTIVNGVVDQPAEAPVAEAHEPEHEDHEEDDGSDTKTSFKYYVLQICRDIAKSDPQYSEIRTSPLFREYISDLLIEFIQRICPLIFLTAHSMKNKTINDVAILRTIEGILIDCHAPHETIELKNVPDPKILKVEERKIKELVDAAIAAEKKKGGVVEVDKKKINDQIRAQPANKIDLDKIPKVLVCERIVTYPTSGYAALEGKIKQKMKAYDALSEKEKLAV